MSELNFAEQRLISQPVVEHAYLKNSCEMFSSDTFKHYEVDGKYIAQNILLSLFMDRLVEDFDLCLKKDI